LHDVAEFIGVPSSATQNGKKSGPAMAQSVWTSKRFIAVIALLEQVLRSMNRL